MATSVDVAVENFIAVVTAAIPATVADEGATQVVFGDAPKYVAPVTLQIMEVTGDAKTAEMGPNFRREEAYSIVCEIVTFAGDQNFTQRFIDCVAIFKAVIVAVGNNPWLSTSGLNDSTAAVRFAEIGDFSIVPHATARGQSVCSLQFHVRCSQRVNSLT
jgi:hypothetical protein